MEKQPGCLRSSIFEHSECCIHVPRVQLTRVLQYCFLQKKMKKRRTESGLGETLPVKGAHSSPGKRYQWFVLFSFLQRLDVCLKRGSTFSSEFVFGRLNYLPLRRWHGYLKAECFYCTHTLRTSAFGCQVHCSRCRTFVHLSQEVFG